MYGANRKNWEVGKMLQRCLDASKEHRMAIWPDGVVGTRDYGQTTVGKNWGHGCVIPVICIEEDPRRKVWWVICRQPNIRRAADREE